MPVHRIPHTAPWITDREIEAVEALLRDGRIGSNADSLRSAEDALLPFTDGHRSLLTTSCTHAMELALHCIDVKAGDEVIVPSFTFVSTANAVLQCGGTPVLVDIEDRTLNLDVTAVGAACTPRTRAIMPVHYGGISCDMDVLLELARSKGIHIIEDAAHALGSRYKGKHLGTIGTVGCFSFHDTKNCVSGEGGAAVINDPGLIERAEWIYDKGTNRNAFLRGEIDKYTWVCQGSSYTMSALLAALLAVQLSRYEEILHGRQRVARRYRESLASLAEEGHIRFPEVPDYATTNEHLAFFLMQDAKRRDALLAHLQSQGIQAYFHYIPLHLSPYGQEHLGTRPGQFPVSERVAASIVRLPLYPQMQDDDCAYVVESVRQFFHPELPHHGSRGTAQSGAQEQVQEALDLSLVIPCYQEEGHLEESLDEILKTLDHTSLRYEIILIDDASTDRTAELIRQYVATHSHHRLRSAFHRENRGRGATVQHGFEMAHGRFVGFIDIDLEIHISYLLSALMPLMTGATDMVIADRHYFFQWQTIPRLITTKGYRWLVRLLLGIPSLDTESGFKFFRRDRIVPLLKDVRDERWFWDTEVTVRSYDAGLHVHSEPVLFERRKDKKSTVRLLRDGMRSIVCLVRFARERAKTHRLERPSASVPVASTSSHRAGQKFIARVRPSPSTSPSKSDASPVPADRHSPVTTATTSGSVHYRREAD